MWKKARKVKDGEVIDPELAEVVEKIVSIYQANSTHRVYKGEFKGEFKCMCLFVDPGYVTGEARER